MITITDNSFILRIFRLLANRTASLLVFILLAGAAITLCQLPKNEPSNPASEDFLNPAQQTVEEVEFFRLLKPIAYEIDRSLEHKTRGGIYIHFLRGDEKKPLYGHQKRMVQLSDLQSLPKFNRVKGIGFPSEAVITDEWLAMVANYDALEYIWLGATETPENRKITSEGLKVLTDLPIRGASLHGCVKLDDEAMKTIADWEELQELYLTDLPLSDRGIYTIRGCRKLKNLDISCTNENGNQVTDVSISTLKGFTELVSLDIWHTRISKSGYNKLENIFPKCKINWRAAYQNSD